MIEPKLKAGDTFIYTKEMDIVKTFLQEGFTYPEQIGKEITITAVYGNFYHTDKVGAPLFKNIDFFLPINPECIICKMIKENPDYVMRYKGVAMEARNNGKMKYCFSCGKAL